MATGNTNDLLFVRQEDTLRLSVVMFWPTRPPLLQRQRSPFGRVDEGEDPWQSLAPVELQRDPREQLVATCHEARVCPPKVTRACIAHLDDFADNLTDSSPHFV